MTTASSVTWLCGLTFVPADQAAVALQPGQARLDDPAVSAQLLGGLHALACDAYRDPASADLGPQRPHVIGPAGVQFRGSVAGTACDVRGTGSASPAAGASDARRERWPQRSVHSLPSPELIPGAGSRQRDQMPTSCGLRKTGCSIVEHGGADHGRSVGSESPLGPMEHAGLMRYGALQIGQSDRHDELPDLPMRGRGGLQIHAARGRRSGDSKALRCTAADRARGLVDSVYEGFRQPTVPRWRRARAVGVPWSAVMKTTCWSSGMVSTSQLRRSGPSCGWVMVLIR